jgi:hypothetical protein
MAGHRADPRRVLGFLNPASSAYLNRRRFLRRVLPGSAIAGAAAAFPHEVDASAQLTGDTGVFGVGGLRVATENLAKFTVPERDQTHALFNNTHGDPNGPHLAMIAALSGLGRFNAMAAWDWLPWQYPYGHAWHSIYHGLDTAAGINTDSRFPFSISKRSALTLDIPNVYVTGSGKWGLGFDIFLFKSATPWDPSNVQAEIFIALKRQGYPNPPEVWSTDSCGVTYGCGRWPANSNLYFFWRKDDPAVPFRQQINIYDFVNALKTRGGAQDSNILSGVYFGAEPIEGWGIWCIDSFYTTLAP